MYLFKSQAMESLRAQPGEKQHVKILICMHINLQPAPGTAECSSLSAQPLFSEGAAPQTLGHASVPPRTEF